MRLGVIMDPINKLNYKKDSTLAMLWEAQDRAYELYYFEQKDLFLQNGVPFGNAKRLQVYRDPANYFALGDSSVMPLGDLQVILMRKDPPFNEAYIYSTYILEHAERLGALVINRAQSLRDANEKLFATYFPQCSPPTIVTQVKEKLHSFWQEQRDIVCKPLDTMGGMSIFRLRENEINANVIFDTLTDDESTYVMAQRFIPEITAGDKRIILVAGKPIPYVLARIPQGNDWRGNLAVGAKGVIQPLTERDKYICTQLEADLIRRGLYFVGIDIIGDYLTEVNVTSPTGIREIDEGGNVNISAELFNYIESR